MVFLHPQPALEDPERLYDSEYYAAGRGKFGGLTSCAVEIFTFARARQLMLLLNHRTGRVLDMGCGRGQFLRMLAARGFECFGTEIHDYPVTREAKSSGVTYLLGEGATDKLESRSFDAVCIWNVLEHVARPWEALLESYRLLKPGGVLLISLPNVDSWVHRLTGNAWFHLDVPRHIFHFNEKAIRCLLERVGFKIRDVSHYSLQYGPFGILQSLMNWAGWRRDALYEILKTHPRYVEERYPRWFRCWNLAIYFVGMPLCVLPSLGLSLVGSGEVMSVWAVRSL